MFDKQTVTKIWRWSLIWAILIVISLLVINFAFFKGEGIPPYNYSEFLENFKNSKDFSFLKPFAVFYESNFPITPSVWWNILIGPIWTLVWVLLMKIGQRVHTIGTIESLGSFLILALMVSLLTGFFTLVFLLPVMFIVWLIFVLFILAMLLIFGGIGLLLYFIWQQISKFWKYIAKKYPKIKKFFKNTKKIFQKIGDWISTKDIK